jgi:hypothetical protein
MGEKMRKEWKVRIVHVILPFVEYCIICSARETRMAIY